MKKFEQQLKAEVRGDVYFDDIDLGLYSTDASIYQIRPVCVVVVRDEEDVVGAMKVANRWGVSILPRGGGTSLGGQAIGEAMVLDFSKYMNDVIEVNRTERWARVTPGVVLDELNRELEADGLHFAPDPATSSRATIGGMIGNNSSGAKSIIYGITADHVLELRVVLSDGQIVEFGSVSKDEYDRRCNGQGVSAREAEIYSGFKRIVETNSDEIEKRFPKVARSVQGYNLDRFVGKEDWNLAQLITGSEGTLGVVVGAKINLEPLPKCKAICAVHFDDFFESIREVGRILTHRPSAVEIIDGQVIRMAKANLSISKLCDFIKGNPKAILVVEFFGETQDEVAGKVKSLADDLRDTPGSVGYEWVEITDPAEQENVWAVRKNGLGLILGVKGDRKPIAFIEDACLPIDVLADYIDELLAFCVGRGVELVMYAHVSVGVIHVRPVLDLRMSDDIESFKAISEFAFGLVCKYGGAWSSEHGDGRSRSAHLERFFGPVVYGALKDVKKLFDSDGLMNPGLIVDAGPIDQNLRYGVEYKVQPIESEFHYRDAGGFAAAVEMCSGVGVCRQLAGTMCPSFKVTGDEKHSTRGRANALRLAMSGQLPPPPEGHSLPPEVTPGVGVLGEKLLGVMDLCLSCKGCKSECPSNVDMAKLKSEFLQKYHDAHGVGLLAGVAGALVGAIPGARKLSWVRLLPGVRERFVCNPARMGAMFSGWWAPVVNWVQVTWLFRKILERIVRIDSRRKLPGYARESFDKWFTKRTPVPGSSTSNVSTAHQPSGGGGKVVLFEDTYMKYYEDGVRVGISAVELLESCGYEVLLAGAGCCQRPRISHGFLRDAKREGEKTLRKLDEYIGRGLKVVVCEPSCASALTDDLPDLIDDVGLGERVAGGVMMIDEFLAKEIQAGRIDCQLEARFQKIVVHGHCHQKSLYGTPGSSQPTPESMGGEALKVSELDSGCCGMAGSFGYESEHYDLSMAIGELGLFDAIRGVDEGAVVVACGFNCRSQIADGTGVKAVHWVETARGVPGGK